MEFGPCGIACFHLSVLFETDHDLGYFSVQRDNTLRTSNISTLQTIDNECRFP